jgi:hypothetical protein
MVNFYIYTGTTKAIAEQKAIDNLALVNAKFVEITGDPWGFVQKLTAEPIIDENTYYYGFQSPPTFFTNGAVCDLDTEFQFDWMLSEEE